MNVLSLFSGIGGLDLGLERAGMTVVGQVEIDPWCRTILSKHWPEVPRHDDVRTCVEWWDGRPVDLVCGGFPCQPTSIAGKRKAQADSRWLWPAFADVIRDLRPAYVLVENPSSGFFAPVAVKDGDGRFLGYGRPPVEDVLGDLAALGYDAEWDCVPAAFVGAPHIRDRVFIVAYPAGARRASGQPGESGPVRDEARRPKPERRSRDVADAEGQRSELRAATGQRPGRPASRSDALADPARIRDGRPRQRTVDGSPGVGGTERLGAIGAQVLADTDGERRGNGPRIFRRVGPPRCSRWTPEPGVGRVAHGIPRRVDRLRGLGNAVVPQVAEHIGHLIMNAEATA